MNLNLIIKTLNVTFSAIILRLSTLYTLIHYIEYCCSFVWRGVHILLLTTAKYLNFARPHRTN